MNIPVLENAPNDHYDFLKEIIISNESGSTEVDLHPLIIMSASFALDSLTEKANNRLAIVFPRRFHSPLLITLICALKHFKEKHEFVTLDKVPFSMKQKILLNGCLVEYIGKDISNHQIIVKCRDGKSKIPFHAVRMLEEVRSEKQLDKMEDLSYASFSEKSPDVLNRLLKIHGNHIVSPIQNVMLISKIGETEKQINSLLINGTKVIDLFRWGKITSEGETSVIASYQSEVDPVAIISPDFFRASYYLENYPDKTGAVIVDGLTGCINNLQILDDDILANNTPTVVILDQSEIGMIEHLELRGFRIWQWNKENKNLSKPASVVDKHSVFYQIDKAMNNFTKLEVSAQPCEFPLVKQAFDFIRRIKKVIDKNNEQTNELLNRIIFIVLELSRIIRVPTKIKMEELEGYVKLLKHQLKQARMWMTAEQEQLFISVLDLLLSIDINKFSKKKHKIAILKERLQTSNEWDNFALVVHRKSESENCRDFWGGEISLKNRANTSFYTLTEIVESDLFYSPTEIIICGWLGYEKMTKIINSCFSSKITLLLYSYEMEWYWCAKQKWNKNHKYNVRYSDFPQVIIKEAMGQLDNFEDVSVDLEAINEFQDFELRMNEISYSQYIASPLDRAEAVQAKMVRFTGSQFSFCTVSYNLHVVTELIRRNTEHREIPKKTINELNEGDLILFRDSDNDIIREIADVALKKNGLIFHRKRASIWRDTLLKKYAEIGYDINKLYQHLRVNGCKRHITTIRNWLFNESIIGPGSSSDLTAIARATEDEYMLSILTLIEESISQLRSAHLQAAAYLQKTMLNEVKNRIDRNSVTLESNIVFNLEGLGQIHILQVEEICEEWLNIGIGWTNRLLKQEENIWRG